MATVLSRGQTIARLGAVALLSAALLAGWSAPATAATCAYDTGARHLTVTVPSTASTRFTISAPAPYLQVDDAYCALLADVNTVSIDASQKPEVQLTFDLSDGPLGPGFTNEGDGSSEIEFSVSGANADTRVLIFGTNGDDHITLGTFFNRFTGLFNGQINLNASVDSTPDTDITLTTFPGQVALSAGSGADVLSGTGVGAVSPPYAGSIHFGLDLGSDTMIGGSGPDEFIVGLLTDPGDNNFDTFRGGGGGDTALLAGSLGASRAIVTLDDVANDGAVCSGTKWCQVNDVGSDIETIVGSDSSETIIGTKGAQTFRSGLGDDLLKGLGGNDLFIPEYSVQQLPRLTTIRGGKGMDTVSYADYEHPVTVTLDGQQNDGAPGDQSDDIGHDVERVIGTAWNDAIRGGSGRQTLDGRLGDDNLDGQGGDDKLLGRGGNDALNGGPGYDICRQGAGSGSSAKCEA